MKKKEMTAGELAAQKELEAKRAKELKEKKAARREAVKSKIDLLAKADKKTVTKESEAVLATLQETVAEAIADALDTLDMDEIADEMEKLESETERTVEALESISSMLEDADIKNFKGTIAGINEKLLKVRGMIEKNGANGNGNARKTIKDIVFEKAQSLETMSKNDAATGVKIGFKMYQKDMPDFMGVVTKPSVTPQPNAYLPAPTIAAGVVPVMQTQPKILDAVRKQPITTPSLVTINRTPVEGDFEWTAEGSIKPFLKFGYETELVTARKLPARTKTSREALSDIAFIQADTEMILEDTYKRKLSSEILNGDGQKSSVDGEYRILGLKHYAPTYVQVCMNGSIENPGISEVLKAAATQIRNMGAEGQLVAFVNPCDWAIETMRKDKNGALLDVSKLLDGITVVETGEIETGEFLIGDLSVFTLYVYEDFEISYGYSNDDFDRNLVSVVAEGRVFGFVSSNNVGALCADSIASVKALIAKV
jgi:tetrahydromethanopterin S-methyltransferase subunit B